MTCVKGSLPTAPPGTVVAYSSLTQQQARRGKLPAVGFHDHQREALRRLLLHPGSPKGGGGGSPTTAVGGGLPNRCLYPEREEHPPNTAGNGSSAEGSGEGIIALILFRCPCSLPLTLLAGGDTALPP